MVGDNPDADVAGARAAGMHAVLLDRSRASSAEKRDLSTISTLHELIQRILGKRTVEWTA
ncbi:HAD hydrolase-like protein [Nesterenkonia salmonea]